MESDDDDDDLTLERTEVIPVDPYRSRIRHLGQKIACFRHISTSGFRDIRNFSDFRAIAHGIGTRQGCNTFCCHAMARKRTVDDSMTYWFPWNHPLA